MKKILSIMLVCTLCMFVCACSFTDETEEPEVEIVVETEEPKIENTPQSNKLGITFSEFYQSAPLFDETEMLLIEYFNILSETLDKSDKFNFNSFVLPYEYEELKTKLTDYNSLLNKESDRENLRRNAMLLLPYTEAETKIAELNLLLAFYEGDVADEEWFGSFEDFIIETCEQYRSYSENETKEEN